MTSRTPLHLALLLLAVTWTPSAFAPASAAAPNNADAQETPLYVPPLVATLPPPSPPPPPPPSARDMVVEAIKNGSKEEIATIVKYAKRVSPDEKADIDALHKDYLTRHATQLAAAKAAKEEALRTARFFDNWKGEGELGAFLTTGNTEASGVSGGLRLKREGLQWRHNLFASADYQRTNGVTSREYIVAGYKPDWKINDSLYVYGLGQYERDIKAGYGRRLSLGPGLGYKVINTAKAKLDLEAGASLRDTQYLTQASETTVVGRLAANLGWQISPTLRLSENAAVHFEPQSANINALTSLDFKVSKKVSTRLSYLLLHETDPLPGREMTDGTTRFTVVYGF